MKANRHIIILKILGGIIVLSSLAGFFMLLYFTPATYKNSFFWFYAIVHNLIFVITGIGIFKLKSWARFITLFFGVIKLIQVTILSIRDIGTMIKLSAGFTGISIGVTMTMIGLGVGFGILYYLTRPNVKELFEK